MLSFSRVLGHRRLTTLLSQAIARGTLPPTLLFTGPRGVGKYRVGLTIAAALNCQTPRTETEGFAFDACGSCRVCDRIARGVHADVLTLEPDDRISIKIDVVRDVLERTAFRPFEGRRRAVIIRDADALELPAQHALLKSLEEPPPGTVFVLTSAVPGVLLPTVLSRCMPLRFGRLTETEVAEILTRDYDVSPPEARAAATLADGSVGQALALGSTDVAVLRETAVELLRQTAKASGATARLQAGALLATEPSRKERTREDVALVLRLVASMLRDIELLNAGGDHRTIANPAVTDDLQALTRAFGGARARESFSAVDHAIAALERNAGTKVVSEWVAMQL